MFKRSESRKLNRLRDYNYSDNGEYFVTICVDKLKNVFGEVNENKIKLNNIGSLAKECWLEIPKHFKNIELDEFVIMPNHIHGIINIYSDIVGDADLRPLQDKTKMYLSKIVHGFKSSFTRKLKEKNINFKWQRSFYDRIIETDEEIDKIRDYIISNPSKWEEDKNNLQNE